MKHVAEVRYSGLSGPEVVDECNKRDNVNTEGYYRPAQSSWRTHGQLFQLFVQDVGSQIL
jgi:hypothetical protein